MKLLARIETMHMIKKGQWQRRNRQAMTATYPFYSLTF